MTDTRAPAHGGSPGAATGASRIASHRAKSVEIASQARRDNRARRSVSHNRLKSSVAVAQQHPQIIPIRRDEIELAVRIQVGHHQGGDPFFRGDRFDAKPRVSGQFIEFAAADGFGLLRQVGFAGLVVK